MIINFLKQGVICFIYKVNKYLKITGKPHRYLSLLYYIGLQHNEYMSVWGICASFSISLFYCCITSLQSEDFRRATRENLTNILQQQQQRMQNPPPQPMTNVQYLPGGGASSVAPPNIPPQYIQQQQQQRMIFVSGSRWILIIFGTV